MNTNEIVEQLRRKAVNDTTRAVARAGLRLTNDQVDDLGEEVLDWVEKRLEVRVEVDYDGVLLRPLQGRRLHPGDQPVRGTPVVLYRSNGGDLHGVYVLPTAIETFRADGAWVCPEGVNGYWYGTEAG